MAIKNRKTQARVSIIVPVYNKQKFLHDTLRSVLGQTYDNWELILVDDKSTDGSVAVIESYQKRDTRIKLIRNKMNKGVAVTRNVGITKAEGRYVAFLDADDIWLPQKLQRQISFMIDNSCAFTFTGYEFANEFAQPNGTVVRVPAKMSKTDYLRNNLIWTSTVVIDTEYIDKCIFKMPSKNYGEDALAWCAILSNIQYAYGIDVVTAYYRRTGDSLSASKHKIVFNKFNLYWSMNELTPMERILYFGSSLVMATRKRI